MEWLDGPKSLSAKDMDRLAGHPIMLDFLSNCLVIKFVTLDIPSFSEMGFTKLKNFYHVKVIEDGNCTIVKAQFQKEDDKEAIQEQLTVLKLKYSDK